MKDPRHGLPFCDHDECPPTRCARLAGDFSPSPVRQGWRAFECDECGHKWEWPSRDRFSPSGENCPKCGEWLFPCGNREDATLPVDDSGNLKIAWNTLPNDKALAQPGRKETL